MESNHNSALKVNESKFTQGKDNNFSNTPKELNPVFDDLNNPATFLNHFEELKQKSKEADQNKGLFKVMTANKWLELAKSTPVSEMLFSEFWHEGELCILFSDSNLGKSIGSITDSVGKLEKCFT
jgi:hypothetical protein